MESLTVAIGLLMVLCKGNLMLMLLTRPNVGGKSGHTSRPTEEHRSISVKLVGQCGFHHVTQIYKERQREVSVSKVVSR